MLDRVECLREKFQKVAGSGTAKSSHIHAPAFADDLQIGSLVYFNGKKAIADYSKKENEHYRPGLVYGLWRKSTGQIDKVEVMCFTTRLSRIYSSDLLILTPQMQQQFFSSKQTKLVTANIVVIDNKASIFETGRRLNVIDESFWPVILARRSHNILYNGVLQNDVSQSCQDLIREGFVFETISEENARVNGWRSDLQNDDIARLPTPILSQAMVNDIAEFSNSFHLHEAGQGRKTIFPSFENWPVTEEETPIIPFPIWRPAGP